MFCCGLFKNIQIYEINLYLAKHGILIEETVRRELSARVEAW